jgi:probable poly-beta-1,6-N-acetyl-D-glucosamine export protein
VSRKLIHEIYWIRALACLSVVMIHAVTRTVVFYELPETTITFFRTIQMLLMFATPMFILLSEVVLSSAYPNGLPKGFYKKRFQFIFLPYIFVAILYTFFFTWLNGNNSIKEMLDLAYRNIVLAEWHGYFIIIIFQFYILHGLFNRYLKKLPMWSVLLGAFLLNSVYLYVVNFVEPMEFPNADVIWSHYSKLLFVAWVFYFAVAYYVGKNLDSLRKYWKLGLGISSIVTVASLSVIMYLYHSKILTATSSLRLDIVFYTVSLFFVLLFLLSRLKSVPKFILIISKYSFSIYLLHMMAMYGVDNYLPKMHIGLYTILMFAIGVLLPMAVSYVASYLPISKYIIGQLKPIPTSLLKKSKEEKYSNENKVEVG